MSKVLYHNSNSKETSSKAHLPIPPDDPAVNIFATMLRKLATISEAEDMLELDYVICHMVSRLTNLVMLWSQS